jgi:hypothetical protein
MFRGADPAEVDVAEADGGVRAGGAAPEDSDIIDHDELVGRLREVSIHRKSQ